MTPAFGPAERDDVGVHQVVWYPDGGRPDRFLVIREDLASPRWSPLADVLVTRALSTIQDAAGLAAATLRGSTGCCLVAVPVGSAAHLLCAAGGDHLLVPGPRCTNIVTLAAVAYIVLVSTGTLCAPAGRSWLDVLSLPGQSGDVAGCPSTSR